MGLVHHFGTFCIFAATVLLVIVSVGTPIWDRLSFVTLNDPTTGVRAVRFGQWGYCSYFGQEYCSPARLGYRTNDFQNVDFSFDNGFTGNWDNAVSRGLTYAIVLNPIAAGFAFIALLFAFASHFILGLFASLLAFWAFLVTLVALALDLACFIILRDRLNDNFADGVNPAHLDVALWLVVAATALLLIGSVTVCFTRNSNKRDRDDYEGRNGWFGRRNNQVSPVNSNVNSADPLHSTNPTMVEKKHFWQRNKAAY